MLKYATREFCLNTGLHGYNFLFLPKRVLLERIIWLVIIILSIIVTIVVSWLAWNNTQKYYIETVTDSTHYPIWNYPFPAVTICGFNQISKSKVRSVIKNINHPGEWSTSLLYQDFKYLIQLLPGSLDIVPQWNLTRFQDLLDHNKVAAEDLFRKVAPNCTEMLQRCKWKGEEIRCQILFEETITTFGFCCSFNYFALKNHAFSGYSVRYNRLPKKPRRVTACGFKTGLEVLVDNKPEDYYATSISSYGHRILIHYPYDFLDGNVPTIMLGLKNMIFLGVSPILAKCSAKAASLHIEDRNCLFFNEKEMHGFQHYTYDNCLTECRAKIIIRLCGCIPFYYYFKNGTSGGNRICNLRDSSCLSKHSRIFMSSVPGVDTEIGVTERLDPCSCLPNCEYCYYPLECSSGDFSRQYSSNEYSLYGAHNIENQSVLRVFFDDLVANKTTILVRYYWHTLFALFGGLVGLFTGFNFGSAFEIIYFFIIRPILKRIKYGTKRTKEGKRAQLL